MSVHLRVPALSLVLIAVWLMSFAPTAFAHDEIIDSNPPADANLDTVPTSVELVFSGRPLWLGATILVVGANGKNHTVGKPKFKDRTVSIPVDDGLVADAFYQIRWRIVSADGHALSGVRNFSVGDVSAAEVLPEPESSSPSSSDQAAVAGGEGGTKISRTVVVALTGAMVALLIAGAATWIGHQRSRTPARASNEEK